MQKLGATRSYTPQGGLSPEGRSELGTPIPDMEGVGERGGSENPLFTDEKTVAWVNSIHMGASEECRVPAETSWFSRLPSPPLHHISMQRILYRLQIKPPLSLSSRSREKQHPLKCASVLCS